MLPSLLRQTVRLADYPVVQRPLPCDLCGGGQFHEISGLDRQGAPLSTVICDDCGLVCQADIPSEEELQQYYSHAYRAQYHGRPQPKPHRVLRAWQAGQHYLRLLQPFLVKGMRVCEIGAGLGGTVKAFALAGHQAWGVEPGASFLHYARHRLHADVRQGTWADIRQEAELDLILLIHVIEHLGSPRAALSHIHRLLRPGGMLYVECPNLVAPHSAPGRAFHRAHLYDFTPTTLTHLARSCGFEVHQALHQGSQVGLLLQRGDRHYVPTDADAAEQTLRGWLRYNRWQYYGRPSYWIKRCRRDLNFLSHRWLASWRVTLLERQLEQRLAPDTTTDMTASVRRGVDQLMSGSR